MTANPCRSRSSAQQQDSEHDQPVGARNILFMGTNVVSGTATAVVVRTGDRTYFGALAQRVTTATGMPTQFQTGVNKVTWLMIRFMVVMVPLVFLINGLTKDDWLEALLFAVAVAVGLTPEMLPMIVTVNLAKGALAMSRAEGHRQAPQCDPELRRDGRSVHRQDRHADAGPDHPGAAPRHPRREVRASAASTPISTATSSPG